MEIHSTRHPSPPRTRRGAGPAGRRDRRAVGALEAATARLLDLIREFDARGGWNTGFRSCAAWLSWRVGLDLGAAREKVRVARALGTLPLLAEALARGELSYAKVRALTRVATPETEERLLGVGRGRHGRPRRADRARLAARGPARPRRGRPQRQHASRALHVYQDEDGTVVLRGRLAPEVGALLRARAWPRPARRCTSGAGVRQQVDPPADPSADPPDDGPAAGGCAGAARGDGAAPRARSRRAGRAVPGGGPRRRPGAGGPGCSPASPSSRTGARVSAETSRRLACDASRVVMRHDEDGRVVEIGARTRTIPPALRRALHHRDRGCRFPGCGLPFGRGASRPPLGARRPDHALEPRAALSPAPPRRPRGGLPGRSTARRRAPVPAAGRPAPARGPAAGRGARRSGPGPPRAARRAGAPPPRADDVPGLARASAWMWAGRSTSCIPWPTRGVNSVTARVKTAFDGMIAAARSRA